MFAPQAVRDPAGTLKSDLQPLQHDEGSDLDSVSLLKALSDMLPMV